MISPELLERLAKVEGLPFGMDWWDGGLSVNQGDWSTEYIRPDTPDDSPDAGILTMWIVQHLQSRWQTLAALVFTTRKERGLCREYDAIYRALGGRWFDINLLAVVSALLAIDDAARKPSGGEEL